MSHQDLAAVWSTLHCRADIDNILQELIGRYFLDVSELTSDRGLFRATAFSHVVALRTIFDLQRTYMQSPHLSFESRTSLLNPDILFSAIKHILGVKISAFCAHDGLPNHDAYCSFIGQALVSGTRALHLHKRRLSLAEYEAVIDKFKQAWGHETLRGVDHFSINVFCQRMLTELSNNEYNHGLSTPACGVIRLQDFYYGLYPLDDDVNAFLLAAKTAIKTSRSSADWFYCALVLYDISWATIAAMIQMCMDNQYYKGLNHSGLARDTALLTLSPRFKMLDHLFKDSTPSPPPGELEWAYEQTQTMLCMAIRAKCFGQECFCLGAHSKYLLELVTLPSEPSSENLLTIIVPVGTTHFHGSFQEYNQTLGENLVTLEARHNILPDVSKELLAFSQKIVDYTNEWCPGIPKSVGYDHRTSTTPDDIYIVNCPELHPVPGKIILPSIEENTSTRPQHANLSPDDIGLLKDVPSRTGCGQCSHYSVTTSARKIEPLSRMSIYIQEKLKERRKMLRTKGDSTTKGPSTAPSSPQSGRAMLSRRHEPLNVPRRSQEPLRHELPTIVNTLPSIRENTLSPTSPETATRLHRSLMGNVDMHGSDLISPAKPSSPATTYVGSSSALSHCSDPLSRPSSRTFSPPPFPTPEETTNLPEVVVPDISKLSSPTSPRSIPSDASSSIFQSPSRKWPFRSRRGPKGASNIPTATFFTSGRTLLLWNDRGACSYDLQNMLAISHRIITPGDILLAAGGTRKSGIVIGNGPIILLRIFQGSTQAPIHEMEIEQVPFVMALSSNDHYLAMKFGNYVRILDTLSGAFFHHKLPPQSGRSGPKDHLVTFSTDCLSFAAATRFEPEKVVTYFCECQNPSNGGFVESSAPFGLVGDDGLSSIVVSDNSALLTTFTEKGYPAYLTLLGGRSSSRVLRDKNQQVGSRIHSTALCATGQNLALLNDRNEIFWIESPFGKERAPTRVGSIKREKSVKREVEIAMPNSDEVLVFWIYKGKGILVTMGRGGGKSKPLELDIDLDHLLESE
ncbi:uncharacterized protein PAC_16724 [Phialocephala subalpina]|uniref:Uncharacterized protein n=1 Tax=Phialocephala subalpina TaxID=576137 RepID=A0A1L7XP67_9HELO|nr:uncharacterized protein PAC_16724 [Phialocephala subalpina]